MKELNGILCDGDQYFLELFTGVPWEGRSPRSLTRAVKQFIFEAGAGGHEVVFCDPDQLDFWRRTGATRKRGGRSVAPAAPLLSIRLKRTRRGRGLTLRRGDF